MATKPVSKKTSAKKTSAKVSKAKKEVVEAVDAIEDVVESKSKSILSAISKNFGATQNVAKQLWLANLGAAGRTYEEAVSLYAKAEELLQTRYKKLNQDSQELVEDLVVRGEKVQNNAEAKIKEGRATAKEQIEAAKDRISGLTSVVDIPARLQDLSSKLESLSKDLKKSA